MQHWFFKYKIYHIPFWIAYHLLWLMINVGSMSGVFAYLFQGELPVKFLGYIIFQAAAAYFNLYFLIPKFLYVGKYKAYLFLMIVTILVCSVLIVSGYYLNAYVSRLTFFQLFNKQPDKFFIFFSTNALPSTLGSMTLAMSVKLTKNWLSAEKKRLILEKENVETELKYLKSQINPHFLFNTINSIFVLIHKNPDLASESLASFSNMLRYQLYECNDWEIPLHKDLQFLENFIELETLRINENQTELIFEINHTSSQNMKIAPFILLPFVENAFKHVSRGRTQKNFIKMYLEVDVCSMLRLSIENSRDTSEIHKKSGIGLKNVQRRLNLIYPNKYHLTIESDLKTFKIVLLIDLK
ncbi:MAG: histidine kinase [Microscillaceae bacterium]|nr:histidine kinase [Microscillaceae bacterium]